MVPILAGLSGRGVRPLTVLSACVALFGVGLLEQGGAAPDIGDAWNLISAFAFGLQVGSCATTHGASQSGRVCTCWHQLCSPAEG